MPIVKSEGVTATEKLLASLCDRTFLRLWSYPNPHQKPGTELCDVVAIFEKQVFLFFDREVRKFDGTDDVALAWERWHRKVVTAQIATAKGAKRHIENGGDIFLDAKCTVKIPLPSNRANLTIHRIIVAHGAKEACESYSHQNVYGSMAITYGEAMGGVNFPFTINLDREDPVHVLDSHNLQIVLSELDTISDLADYFLEKERAIGAYQCLSYVGEEDLLAHYFLNINLGTKKYSIGPRRGKYDFVMIGEGEWHDFQRMPQYKSRKEANAQSYFWDDLIQRTGQHTLDGTGWGNTDAFSPSAIHEMAKEPRLARRAFSRGMIDAIRTFPENRGEESATTQKISCWRSSEDGKAYIFLQLRQPSFLDHSRYREARSNFLMAACGIARNKFPDLTKVVGIAMAPPKFARQNSEDFVLFDCSHWSDEDRAEYEALNEELRLFSAPRLQKRSFTDFPNISGRKGKPGPNERCPCGSGKKFKKCHGANAVTST